MKRLWLTVAIIGLTALTQAQYSNSRGDLPAFHNAAPSKGQTLPLIWTDKQLAAAGFDQPAQKASYKAAAKLQGVLYQLPCYCHCDQTIGHQSLRSCFEGNHGANCGTCMAEALYAYKMTKKGWTPKMVRDGIIRGDFKMINLQNPEPVI